MTESSLIFNPDRPIKFPHEDSLNRKGFAKYIAKAILESQTKDSLVIGLLGEWGSGKTSLVNMTIDYINTISDSLEQDEKPIIIYFNPWNFSGQNQLISQFFNKLSFTLGRLDYSDGLTKASQLLKTASKITKSFTYFLPFNVAASACSDMMTSMAEATESAGKLLEKDLDGTKNDISDILEKQSMKIIILIDDIDRLNNVEIRQIFQLVKSLADFPNTVYLLTFDKDIVIEALEKDQTGHGTEYLEKIVQVPLDIPLISSDDLEKLLTNQLRILMGDLLESESNRIYWGNVYYSGFKHFFKNIRDVTRYINVLRFSYGLVKDEVNPIDFIAITSVQVFIPEIYHKIKDNKKVFTNLSTLSESDKIEFKHICEDIISCTDQRIQKFLLNFLKTLFPNLNTIYENTIYGANTRNWYRANRRICSEDVFDTYFKLSLPNGEISQKEIRSIINLENEPKEFSNKLIEFSENGKISRFLAVFPDHVSKIQMENIGNVISSILDTGDRFPDDRSILYGTPMSIHYITRLLLERLNNQNERFTILENSIKDSTSSLYTFVWEIDYQDELQGRYNYKKANDSEKVFTISPEQLDTLEKLVCTKIETWADQGKLKSHPKVVPILQTWKQWGADQGNIDSVIEEIIECDDCLINFLSNCISPHYSHCVTDYVGETTWRIHFGLIEDFIDLNVIETRLNDINFLNKVENMTDMEKLAIELFLENIEKYKLNPDQKIQPYRD